MMKPADNSVKHEASSVQPVVVIATHKRVAITITTARNVLDQGAQLVLVYSDRKDRTRFMNALPEAVLCRYPNKPLGAKWQHGVDVARNMDHSHIIILGSDDLLSKNYFHQMRVVERFSDPDFSGFRQWYVYHGDTLYLFNYRPQQVLGGGRFYSRALLAHLNYQLFDTSKNRRLDDADAGGYAAHGFIVENDLQTCDMAILAVKGNWEQLNDMNKTLAHKNAILLNTWKDQAAAQIVKEKFGYVRN